MYDDIEEKLKSQLKNKKLDKDIRVMAKHVQNMDKEIMTLQNTDKKQAKSKNKKSSSSNKKSSHTKTVSKGGTKICSPENLNFEELRRKHMLHKHLLNDQEDTLQLNTDDSDKVSGMDKSRMSPDDVRDHDSLMLDNNVDQF